MRRLYLTGLMTVCLATAAIAATATKAAPDPLPSWRDGNTKEAILGWLSAVTDTTGGDFVPLGDRIAVFDNDGTSWCEEPHNNSTAFQVSLARSRAAAGQIDAEAMPYRAWFADDRQALRSFGWGKAYQGLNDAFAGMLTTAYRDSARSWLKRNRHERFDLPLTDLYYAPMLELKDLLITNGFQVWIVTGSAQDFVRSFSETVLGIPPGQVIGTWTQPRYSVVDGVGVLKRGSQQNYNGYENKPASIETRIGKRPIFAAGNSNNDQPMMNWCVTGTYRGLALWIHHDDDVREYAKNRGTDKVAKLAAARAKVVEVSMKKDWRRIF